MTDESENQPVSLYDTLAKIERLLEESAEGQFPHYLAADPKVIPGLSVDDGNSRLAGSRWHFRVEGNAVTSATRQDAIHLAPSGNITTVAA